MSQHPLQNRLLSDCSYKKWQLRPNTDLLHRMCKSLIQVRHTFLPGMDWPFYLPPLSLHLGSCSRQDRECSLKPLNLRTVPLGMKYRLRHLRQKRCQGHRLFFAWNQVRQEGQNSCSRHYTVFVNWHPPQSSILQYSHYNSLHRARTRYPLDSLCSLSPPQPKNRCQRRMVYM